MAVGHLAPGPMPALSGSGGSDSSAPADMTTCAVLDRLEVTENTVLPTKEV